MKPLNDRVLIRRIEEPEQRIGSIIVPDVAKSKAIKGEVMAVGRGKWHPGEFWCVKGKWQWFDGYLEVPSVYPGQIVYFNSKWNDVGEDYQNCGPLWDDKIHMVQVADIFAVINA